MSVMTYFIIILLIYKACGAKPNSDVTIDQHYIGGGFRVILPIAYDYCPLRFIIDFIDIISK
jgi:hypothetical protein